MPAAEPGPLADDAVVARLFAPLGEAEGIGLAVSGGADSLALALLARRWLGLRGPPRRLVVLTVDHGLRPEAADEAARVAAIAASIGLPCRILRWQGPYPGADIEAAARAARYRLLADAAAAEGLSHIATAHHRDDQAETLMLRLARGSGVYGLSGMARAVDRDGVHLVRPLLGVPHADLVAIVEAAGLVAIDDPHNRDARFARARMRALMPALAREGITAERLAATAGRLRRAAAAIDHYVGRLLAEAAEVDALGAIRLGAEAWLGEPEEVRLRALARILRAAGGAEHVPRLESLTALEAALRAPSEGRSGQRTLGGVVVAEEGGAFRFERELGRTGLPTIEIDGRFSGAWDRRFHLDIPAPDTPVTLGALGEAGRALLPAEARAGSPRSVEASPALWSDGVLVAVPMLGAGPIRAGFPMVKGRSIVAARLAEAVEEEQS